MKMRILIVCGLLMLGGLARAQEGDTVVLTLDDCIQTALDRNIQLKRAQNNQLVSEANKFQAIMNFLPSLNANINYDYFFGTFFDQNAARQVSATTNSSSPNVSSGIVLFQGFSNHYNVKQRDYEMDAAIENVENAKLNVEATILTSYLRVILDKENIKISEERVNLLKAQLEREEKRVSVGVGNLESIYNFRSQLASEKLTLNSLQNTLRSDFLALLQAMQMSQLDGNYQIAPYTISEEELLLEEDPFDQVLEQSMENNPALSAARASQKAARFQYKVANANKLPVLSLGGQVGSNYSSNGAYNPTTGEQEPDATFQDQLEYNKYEYLNFSLRIPLFNGYQVANQAQVAKLNMHNAELGVDEALNTVTNSVQQAYLDLINAQNTYVSARENLEALDQTFEFMKKRFETGNTDFYTYLESLNNKNRAEIELVNARYSIIFRKKVLALYRGL